MAIERVGWPTALRIGARIANRSGDGFAVTADRVTGMATAPSGPTEPACLGAVLTLQEMGDQTVQDRRARKHGQEMLALLAAVQRRLLSGEDIVAALKQLAELSDSVPRAADPGLAAIISAIRVRARVELARHRA